MISEDQKRRLFELDEALLNNILWLDGDIHEFYFQEYPKKVFVIFSLQKGTVVRYHEIDKETGENNGVCIVGDEWSVVKKMMQTNKGKNKKKNQKEMSAELPRNVLPFRKRST